jgi:hypothetical protein
MAEWRNGVHRMKRRVWRRSQRSFHVSHPDPVRVKGCSTSRKKKSNSCKQTPYRECMLVDHESVSRKSIQSYFLLCTISMFLLSYMLSLCTFKRICCLPPSNLPCIYPIRVSSAPSKPCLFCSFFSLSARPQVPDTSQLHSYWQIPDSSKVLPRFQSSRFVCSRHGSLSSFPDYS